MASIFSEIEDSRVERSRVHVLTDILIIGILSVIAGGKGWEDMENYGLSKYEWLEQFLALPEGIPSADTFRRVFERIKPKAPQNLALLRRIALNALNLEQMLKRSNRQKSNRAAMDNNYMLTVLTAYFSQYMALDDEFIQNNYQLFGGKFASHKKVL